MTELNPDIIRLTEYSKGAGCGCKISPKALKEILHGSATMADGRLLVGNDHHDDAAVYDMGDGTALISTTDFFMPIVDDAEAFGKVAAANAISDVYAMGGRPLLALAILGWPEKLPASEAARVMAGARQVCATAGIPLAGGHSIESAEPFFGLSVNGKVELVNLKKNNTASEGDLIFLTKPIGLGILSTAQKRKVIEESDLPLLIDELTRLNTLGEQLGKIPEVSAMTDVTGFGLAGHLLEMAEGSRLTAEIEYASVPVYGRALHYLKQRIVPDATFRNWQSYGDKIELSKNLDVMEAFSTLPDPQTNGGLLFAVNPSGKDKIVSLLMSYGLAEIAKPIGHFVARQGKMIIVK